MSILNHVSTFKPEPQTIIASMRNKRQQPIPGRIPDTPDDAPTTTTYLVDEESSTGLKLALPTPLCQNNKATNHRTQKAGFQKRFAGA